MWAPGGPIHPLPPLADARTTPPRLRAPVIVGLALLVAWFGVCYRFALAGLGVAEPPAALADGGDVFWLGRWRMFTDLRVDHTDLLAEAYVGTGWVHADVETLYPSRWDEGPGYLRDDFLTRAGRLAAFAEDACGRVPGAARVRLTLVTWPKTLGQVDQPRVGETRRELLDHPCGGRGPAGGRP